MSEHKIELLERWTGNLAYRNSRGNVTTLIGKNLTPDDLIKWAEEDEERAAETLRHAVELRELARHVRKADAEALARVEAVSHKLRAVAS